MLTGNPGVAPDKHFYRYFKRDTLNSAMAEINAMATIQVALIEHKKGRKVVELQFAISARAQAQLELPPPPIIDSALLDRITALGVSKKDAEDIFAAHPETTLRAVLSLAEARLDNRKLPELHSPAAFFKSALRQGYLPPPGARPRPKPENPRPLAPEVDPIKAAARDAARKRFSELEDPSQIALLAEFESANAGNNALLRALRKSGLKSKVVEVPFITWLADRDAAAG